MKNLVWFKSDLRVSDNPALYNAMSQGVTLAVFILSIPQWQKHGVSLAKQSLVLRQLVMLRKELAALGVPLVVLSARSIEEVPEKLISMVLGRGIQKVYWNNEYELNERRCEERVRSLCSEQYVATSSYDDSVLFAPGSIVSGRGESFKVFSAFKKAAIKRSDTYLRNLYPTPQNQRFDIVEYIGIGVSDAELHDMDCSLELEKTYTSSIRDEWEVGEDVAHTMLTRFIERRSMDYHEQRDFPGGDGTSRLSTYLAIGVLSTRQCLQAASNANEGNLSEGVPGIVAWINELLWREFYRHLLAKNDSLSRFKPFKPETDALPWRHDREAFEAWKNGLTGYPFVDAAMRQLSQTGWMHNRLRMVVAMFLTKHLFIDWRWGESYFMSKLVDGDLASNNGGWQWSASTGVDAVPYFRIFNPARQSQRFDPDGAFIREYVPELRGLSGKSIHSPSPLEALSADYVLPIVDHKRATEQTKYYFSQLNKGRAVG